MNSTTTICAIATAPGGAIGIIRLSGPRSIELVDQLFTPSSGLPLSQRKAGSLTFGTISHQGEILDEVLVSLFRAPHSYTGEEVVEISCHGSSYILQQVFHQLLHVGAHMATPGEFTQRAFLNGKMDLSQAEAVADLIASTSDATHRLAMSQMRGNFSKELHVLRDRLLEITSLLELELDFSEEDVEFADRIKLQQLADHIAQKISSLASSFKLGNVLKNGIPVAIIGETNAGKSTLLNVLVGEDRAIVSDIHGTTRDVIEDTVNLGGLTFRFIDTAGIRETTDAIETLGIERTFQKLDAAHIVLWMIDSTQGITPDAANDILAHSEGKELLLLFNKCDLIDEAARTRLSQWADAQGKPYLFLSAKQQQNISVLQQHLLKAAAIPAISQGDIIVTNARHYEALTHALEAIKRVQQGLEQDLSGDLISEDLRECLHHLADIVGEVTDDDVLGNIFKNFCIGK